MFRMMVKARPDRYIAQPTLALSTCPTLVEAGHRRRATSTCAPSCWSATACASRPAASPASPCAKARWSSTPARAAAPRTPGCCRIRGQGSGFRGQGPALSVQSYRDLLVWQKAMRLAAEAYRLAGSAQSGGVSSDEPAAARGASVPANIAKGTLAERARTTPISSPLRADRWRRRRRSCSCWSMSIC